MSTNKRGGLVPVTVELYSNDARIVTVGEGTGHPGLVITPGIGVFEEDGTSCFLDWMITHVASGRAVHQATLDMPIDYVRDAAYDLADSGIDWHRSVEDLAADQEVLRTIRYAVGRSMIASASDQVASFTEGTPEHGAATFRLAAVANAYGGARR